MSKRGRVRLCVFTVGVLAAVVGHGQVVVENPSFEEPRFEDIPDDHGYLSRDAEIFEIEGWSFDEGPAGADWGITNIDGAFHGDSDVPIPDGDQVLFVQRGPGRVVQTVEGFRDGGEYLLSFYVNVRPRDAAREMMNVEVSLGDEQIGEVEITEHMSEYELVEIPFTYDSETMGDNELVLLNYHPDDPDGEEGIDASVLYDMVQVERTDYVLEFELGSEDHVDIGTEGFGSTGTIEGWWWLEQVDDKQYFFGHTTRPAFGSRIQIYNEGDGEGLSVGLGDDHGLDQDIAALETQTWQHVALVYDEGDYEVYLDGDLVSSGGYEGLDEIGYAHIGNNASEDPDQAPARFIADFRVWNVAQSGSDIQANMNQRLTGGEDGLVGYWPLNEGSGTTANDLSPMGNDGSIEGPQWVQVFDLPVEPLPVAPMPDELTRAAAMEFDGSGAYVEAPSDGLQFSDGMTVSAWFYADSDLHPSDWGAVVSSGGSGDENVRMLLQGGDEGTVYVSVDNSQGSENIGWEFDRWHHYVYAWDGSDLMVYLDGELVVTREDADIDEIDLGEGGGPFFGAQSPGTRHFGGMVCDVRVWSYGRPQAAIMADMYERLTGTEDGLVGYWPMDEGSGDTASDLSPNENHGTREGAEWGSQETPGVDGLHWEDAATILEDAGFQVHIEYVETGEVATGRVATQSPGAGQDSAPYWTVVLLVEGGAESFAPAAPAWLMLAVMTALLGVVGLRMRKGACAE